jgi:hypothetical protein
LQLQIEPYTFQIELHDQIAEVHMRKALTASSELFHTGNMIQVSSYIPQNASFTNLLTLTSDTEIEVIQALPTEPYFNYNTMNITVHTHEFVLNSLQKQTSLFNNSLQIEFENLKLVSF